MEPLNLPIVRAVRRGDFEAVRKLIHDGCDINELNIILEHNYTLGYNALCEAIAKDNFEMVELLIMNGADVNLPFCSAGITPLMVATQRNNVPIIQMLLNNHAKLNIQDSQGKTELHHAANFHSYYSIEVLLKAKADINIKNEKGQRPKDLADPRYQKKLLDLFVMYEEKMKAEEFNLSDESLEFEIEDERQTDQNKHGAAKEGQEDQNKGLFSMVYSWFQNKKRKP